MLQPISHSSAYITSTSPISTAYMDAQTTLPRNTYPGQPPPLRSETMPMNAGESDALNEAAVPNEIIPARFVPFKPTPGLHSPHCPNEATLLGIPPETRNMIYAHLMEDDSFRNVISEQDRQDDIFAYRQGSVDIRHTPAILHVSTQTRLECHQMFLSSTDFVAFVEEETGTLEPTTDHGYAYLLDILANLGPGHVRTIKSITIVCNDSAANSFKDDHGLIYLWDKFVCALLTRGILPEQLRWPGICLPTPVVTQPQIDTWLGWTGPNFPERYLEYRRNLKDWRSQIIRLAANYSALIEPALITHLDAKKEAILLPDILSEARDSHLMRCLKLRMSSSLDLVVEVSEHFNQARYDLEQNPERREVWRTRAVWYEGEKDVCEVYRGKYPTEEDFSSG